MAKRDEVPAESWLHSYACADDYLDCFSISLEGRQDLQTADMRLIACQVLGGEVGWISALMRLRDRIVAPLGLKTTAALADGGAAREPSELQVGDRVAFFKIYAISEDEIVLGEDDSHQDFRVSLLRDNAAGGRLFAATCCRRHNLFGRVYLALILPFHKLIVSQMLTRAVKAG